MRIRHPKTEGISTTNVVSLPHFLAKYGVFQGSRLPYGSKIGRAPVREHQYSSVYILMKKHREIYTMRLDNELFEKAPDPMSKDQFRCVCHISKKTALFLLQSGLVRSENTGKATHTWLIPKTEVLRYVIDSNASMYTFKPPKNYYLEGSGSGRKYRCFIRLDMSDITLKVAREYYLDMLGGEGGLLTVDDISRITGYCRTTVCRWYSRKSLRLLTVAANRYLTANRYLLDWLLSSDYNDIRMKTEEHEKAILHIMARVKSGVFSAGD